MIFGRFKEQDQYDRNLQAKLKIYMIALIIFYIAAANCLQKYFHPTFSPEPCQNPIKCFESNSPPLESVQVCDWLEAKSVGKELARLGQKGSHNFHLGSWNSHSWSFQLPQKQSDYPKRIQTNPLRETT